MRKDAYKYWNLLIKLSIGKIIFNWKQKNSEHIVQSFLDAGGGTWTRTWLPTTDFESASSAIPTHRRFQLQYHWRYILYNKYCIKSIYNFNFLFFIAYYFYLCRDISILRLLIDPDIEWFYLDFIDSVVVIW